MKLAVAALACPTCHGELTDADATGSVRCVACDARFPRRDGALDFAPDLDPQPGLAQRFMEAPPVASVYERYFRPALTRLVSPLDYRGEAAFLERWLGDGPDGACLDLSCGTGHYTRWLAERMGDDRVLGLDLSTAMLRRCRAENEAAGHAGITLVRGSALALPVASASLATVSCFGALHLYPSPARALGEAARALVPGGRLAVLTTLVGDGTRDRIVASAMIHSGVHAFRRAELEVDLDAAGLTLLTLERHGAMGLLAAVRA